MVLPMSGPERRGRSSGRMAVLAVMVAVLLGHVCALPLAPHDDDRAAVAGSADGGSGEDRDTRLESCDATLARPAEVALPVLAIEPPVTRAIAAPIAIRCPGTVALLVPPHPELFLLHASLLI
jgi:hypothetical protein